MQMKMYKRAEERRKGLHSVKYYTTTDGDECEAGIRSRKSLERRTFLRNRKDNGEGGRQPSGDSPEDWRTEIQHQQSDARKIPSHFGFSGQDGRELRARSESKDREDSVVVFLFSDGANPPKEPA